MREKIPERSKRETLLKWLKLAINSILLQSHDLRIILSAVIGCQSNP